MSEHKGSYHYKMPELPKGCTLTDEELVKKVDELVSKLCATKGQAWCLSVPADLNSDPDMLILELIKRFNKEMRNKLVRGRCSTNLDDYHSDVTEFYRVPNIGERVAATYKGNESSLKVCQITHAAKDGEPFIIVELHK